MGRPGITALFVSVSLLFCGCPEPEPLTLREKCYPDVGDVTSRVPEYDRFGPTVAEHCKGTNHQDISGIEKLVFLGDSVTQGTPPTDEWDYYRNQLTRMLEEEHGALEVANCAEWGARTDDLLLPSNQQILTCFPEPEPKRTLVVMTMGGNDGMEAAETMLDGGSSEDALAVMDQAANLMDDAMAWFRDNEAERFPNGVFVIFGNVYEFTDATGDMSACPTAEMLGFSGEIPGMRDAYIHLNERYMKTAVDHGMDMIFMLEEFCGHGFYYDDPENECYKGEGSEIWFDNTCIHPNPLGHRKIAEMFRAVVRE